MDDREVHFSRHGGVHFTPRVPPETINQFVSQLPQERRESFYGVLKALQEAKLITIHNDGILADGEGRIGGSADCGDEHADRNPGV
jgi:hypothetical protein